MEGKNDNKGDVLLQGLLEGVQEERYSLRVDNPDTIRLEYCDLYHQYEGTLQGLSEFIKFVQNTHPNCHNKLYGVNWAMEGLEI